MIQAFLSMVLRNAPCGDERGGGRCVMSLPAASRTFLARRDGNVAIDACAAIDAGVAIGAVRACTEKSKAAQAADGAILAADRRGRRLRISR